MKLTKNKPLSPEYFSHTDSDAVTRIYISTANGIASQFARIAYVRGEWQGFVKGKGLVAFSATRWIVVKAVVRLARAKVKAMAK